MSKRSYVTLSAAILLLALLLLGVSFLQSPAQAQTTLDCTTATEIPQAECEALVALYNSTSGAAWTNNTGWLVTNTPCTWNGISCVSSHVSGIFLVYNQLSGAIPPEIGNLTALQGLYLSSNQLTGTLPPELGNLSALQTLLLDQNQLSGMIPPRLGELANLQTLDLSINQLTGSIPSGLGNLGSLQELYLSWNRLSGSLPLQLGNLTNLEFLHLSSNQLSGSIPVELGNLANLRHLDMGGNRFGGAVPGELGMLSNLQALKFNATQLSGPLPIELMGLTALSSFHFNDTDLCEPQDSAFQTWLDGIGTVSSTGVACALVLTKEADPEPAVAGEVLTYTLTLQNLSPDVLYSDIVLTDTLPVDVTLLSADPAPTTQDGQALTWEMAALALGEVFTATIQAQMPTAPTEIYNQAEASAAPLPAGMSGSGVTEVELARARYTVGVYRRAESPLVTASPSGDDVVLSWDPPAVPVFHHEVWWNESDPYFAPDVDCVASANCALVYGANYTDSGAAASVSTNHTYLVLAVNEAGRSGPSNRVAEFGFALVPGD